MPVRGTTRTRILGAICLGLALLLLILGETAFKGRLTPAGFIAFWSCCLLLTAAAIIVALIDMRRLRRRTRTEHKEIVEATFGEIERKARERNRRN